MDLAGSKWADFEVNVQQGLFCPFYAIVETVKDSRKKTGIRHKAARSTIGNRNLQRICLEQEEEDEPQQKKPKWWTEGMEQVLPLKVEAAAAEPSQHPKPGFSEIVAESDDEDVPGQAEVTEPSDTPKLEPSVAPFLAMKKEDWEAVPVGATGRKIVTEFRAHGRLCGLVDDRCM